MSTPLLARCPVSLIDAETSSVAETLTSTLSLVSAEVVEAEAMRAPVPSLACRTVPDVSLIASMISPMAPWNCAIAAVDCSGLRLRGLAGQLLVKGQCQSQVECSRPRDDFATAPHDADDRFICWTN
jgi:hypothetical protein